MARSKGQGSITLRPDGVWMGRITKNGITKSFYNKDKKVVESKLLEYSKMSELKKEVKVKFSEYVYNYIYTFKYKHIKDSSFDRLDSIYRNHICDSSIGVLPLSQLNDVVVQRYINDKVASGCSLSSTKKIFELVRTVLFYAYKKGDIVVDYSALLKIPSAACFKDVKHIDTYTHEEVSILCNYILNAKEKKDLRFLRYAPAYVFMLNTGLRAGEVLALTWKDIDFNNSCVAVTRTVSLVKNRSSPDGNKYISVVSSVKTAASNRTVPLNETAMRSLRILKQYYAYFDCECDYLVCNYDGDFVKLRSFEAKLEKICGKCGISFKGVHALRHTFASNLIEAGVSPKVVSELLGHTNVVFTLNRYVHTNPAQKINAVKCLENV